MGLILKGIEIENFKSYGDKQYIKFSDLSVLLGANSSGKSTALQAMLVIKQTMECNSPDEELLLSGKYVALGDYDDVISNIERDNFSFAVILEQTESSENTLEDDIFKICWKFKRNDDGTSASLDCIDINFENMELMLKKSQKEIYDLYINGERSLFSVNIYNLLFENYIMHYDIHLNGKALELINELAEVLVASKTTKMSSTKFGGGDAVQEFYFKLMNKIQNNRRKPKRRNKKELAIKVEKLIDKFFNMELPIYNFINGILFRELRVQILEISLENLESIEKIEVIIEKFEKYISEYEKIEHKVEEFEGVYNLGKSPNWTLEKEDEKSNILTQLQYALEFYEEFHSNIISKIFFVGPIRETPKGLYNIGFETIPKYVGPAGSYFASVLLHENKKEKEYILPRRKEKCVLADALAEWMMHLKVASAVDVDKKNSFGFSVSIENMEQVKSDIMNVGIGTSQVLPVLISVLLSEPNEILVFEQPELHLHPYSQSRLADMFIEFCKQGRKIIIETHSEYFLLRLRYHIVKEKCPEDAISINFFQNKGGTKVENKNISGFGNIDYPEDFRDETQELLDDILEAALQRKGL